MSSSLDAYILNDITLISRGRELLSIIKEANM